MNKYKNAIFDVDGTILNTFSGVSACIRYAFERINKKCPSDEVLRSFLGPALADSFCNLAGLTAEETKRAVNYYRERYSAGAVFDCTLFEGYPKLFEDLKKAGVRLSVASSKPKRYIELIFQKLKIDGYFERLIGPDMDSATSDKSTYLAAARLETSAVMVGDRKFDVEAADKIGIDCIGVTYGGFTPDGEFDEFKPKFVADTTDKVFNIITKGECK